MWFSCGGVVHDHCERSKISTKVHLGMSFLTVGQSREVLLIEVLGKYREVILFHSAWPLLRVWPLFGVPL